MFNIPSNGLSERGLTMVPETCATTLEKVTSHRLHVTQIKLLPCLAKSTLHPSHLITKEDFKFSGFQRPPAVNPQATLFQCGKDKHPLRDGRLVFARHCRDVECRSAHTCFRIIKQPQAAQPPSLFQLEGELMWHFTGCSVFTRQIFDTNPPPQSRDVDI